MQDLSGRFGLQNTMDTGKFRAECLEAHNAYRKLHGADPVKLDQKLNDYAQKWAEHMSSNKFEHSTTDYGENIAYTMQSTSPTGYQITKMWYDEEKDYDYSTHRSKNGNAVGHFTQVVWKGTKHVGFGLASRKDDRKYYAVGSYEDAGNITNAGYYAKNVGLKTGEPSLPELQDPPPGDADKDKAAVPVACGDGGDDMPTPGTTVETKTETHIENGVKIIKTTTTTTTVTKQPDGSIRTSTSTKISTQTEPAVQDATEKLEKLAM